MGDNDRTGSGTDSVTVPVGRATDGGASEHGEPLQLHTAGDTIGRYRVERVIGQGGMGIVYGAWDDTLERSVAIKLLRSDVVEAEHVARLRREAQALAQLSHQNVLTIYEVGEHEGQVFLATELVEGEALDFWLAGADRRWTEVVDVMIAAGRGLAAAHAAGLVHRDFKPPNVMLARDGRVKVLDFGLARPPSQTPATEAASMLSQIDGARSGVDIANELDQALTEAGTVMGTPAYMAPEQYRLERVDAKTDQYALCVSMFEGVYRRRAFVGSGTAALRRKIEAGDVGERPPGPAPTRLWRVIRRGMAVRPEDRYPDMDALLRALHRVRHPRRARWAIGAVGLGVAATAMSWTAPLVACDDGRAQWDSLWNDGRRAALEDAVHATELAYAEATWAQVTHSIDEYRDQWLEARAAVCDRGPTDPDFDARLQCLDQAMDRTGAYLEVLSHADSAVVQRAVAAVSRLPSPASCRRQTPGANVPPALAKRVTSLRSAIARLSAQIDAGATETGDGKDRAAATAHELVERARALGYAPTLAKALTVQGRLLRDTGKYGDARAALEEAFRTAFEAGEDRQAAGSGAILVFLLAQHERDLEAAQTWARHTAGAVERLGGDAPGVMASFENARGAVADLAGKPAEADAHYERVAEIRIAEHGRNHLDVATALGNRANALIDLGRIAEAEALKRDALAIREGLLGPDHPGHGRLLADLASVLSHAGKTTEAIEVAERGVELTAKAYGEAHPDVALMAANLATLYEKADRIEEAATMSERALSAATATLGEDHPHVAIIQHNLGGLRRLQGRNAEAIQLLSTSHESMAADLGADHPQLASSLINLGLARLAGGQADEALRSFRRSHEIASAAYGKDHDIPASALVHAAQALRALSRADEALAADREAVAILERLGAEPNLDMAVALTGLGVDLLALARPDEAVAPLRRAVTMLKEPAGPSTVRADAQFALARALAAKSSGVAEARTLAAAAIEGYRPAGGIAIEAMAEVEAWLSAHGRG